MEQHAEKERRILEWLTAAYLSAILVFYLLYTGFGGYQEITEQKWRAYVLLTGVYALSALLLRLEIALVGGTGLPTPARAWKAMSWAQRFVLLYLFAAALSALASAHRRTAVWGGSRCDGLVTIALYCLSFLLVSSFGRPRRRELLLFAAALGACCCLCLAQLAGLDPFRLYPEGLGYHDAGRAYAGAYLGTIGNVDLLSAVLSLAIPALWTAGARVTRPWERVFLLIALALCVSVLVGSSVAGGIVGSAGALLLSAPLFFSGKTGRVRAWIAAACVLAAAALGVYLFGGRLGGFFYEASELMHGRWNDAFGSGRLFIWRNVAPLVAEHPLLGGGPDTLALRTNAVFERYDEALGLLIRSGIDAAHNEYLHILVNQGALGLGFYLAALAASAVKFFRSAPGDPAVLICGSAALGYCIQAFFGISAPVSAPYLWIALALLNAPRPRPEPQGGKRGRSH